MKTIMLSVLGALFAIVTYANIYLIARPYIHPITMPNWNSDRDARIDALERQVAAQQVFIDDCTPDDRYHAIKSIQFGDSAAMRARSQPSRTFVYRDNR